MNTSLWGFHELYTVCTNSTRLSQSTTHGTHGVDRRGGAAPRLRLVPLPTVPRAREGVRVSARGRGTGRQMADEVAAGGGARLRTDEELDRLLLEAEGLDSIEAQAKRMAGMVRENAREREILRQLQRGADGAEHGEDAGGEGLHRRSTRASDDARDAGAQREGGPALDGESAERRRRRRRRRRPDPYAGVPFFFSEIM